MNSHHSIVILTGAGISAESGITTFRDEGGLWAQHRIEDVATPEGFVRDPALVQRFYNARRAQLATVEPNAAHIALARFAAVWPGELLLITQNVDNLHNRAQHDHPPAAGFSFLAMHGELTRVRCTQCDETMEWANDVIGTESCTACNEPNALRPHIVWFGEMPLEMERIERALRRCDLFIAIGTSGNVYPAAGFVTLARMAGARTVELNLEPTGGSPLFDEYHIGPASRTVPDFLATLRHS